MPLLKKQPKELYFRKKTDYTKFSLELWQR